MHRWSWFIVLVWKSAPSSCLRRGTKWAHLTLRFEPKRLIFAQKNKPCFWVLEALVCCCFLERSEEGWKVSLFLKLPTGFCWIYKRICSFLILVGDVGCYSFSIAFPVIEVLSFFFICSGIGFGWRETRFGLTVFMNLYTASGKFERKKCRCYAILGWKRR